ncbi:MAG: diguanylate cyclase [Pseudomonadota bacterium]
MPGRILIVDSVPTHRVVLKVKMLAAQFHVDDCADAEAATTFIAQSPPDLVLLNLAEPTGAANAFCRALREDPKTSGLPVIAVGVADTTQARFAALDAGADDVMPQPLNEALLLARIRSLLRVRSAMQELRLRDSTSRALGFEERGREFAAAARITLLSHQSAGQCDLKTLLSEGLRRSMRIVDPKQALIGLEDSPAPDLFVIDARDTQMTTGAIFGLVSDLHARLETRLAAQLVLVPSAAPDVAAMLLDLGADDIVPDSADPREIILRARSLIARKLEQDRLRDAVRSGLHAAVTDPLTGLFNRRYVDPHLLRLANQSRVSGRALAVMMIDIDHFKAINDTHGHAAGDAVLVELAQRLKENLRAVDLVARMGGEEFLVAMPRTSVKQARRAADRLRCLVNTAPFAIGQGSQSVKITVSIGVALSMAQDQTAVTTEQICRSADEALYRAKSGGRDRVAMGQSAA